MWLDQFPEDFREPPNFPCLSHFESFCRRVMPGSELDSKVQRKGKVLRKVSSNPLWPILQRQSVLWFDYLTIDATGSTRGPSVL